MLPDGAVERVQEVCASIGEACEAAGVAQWDVMGEQSYGLDLNLEAGKITMVGAGGEGGFGVRVVDDGRFGFARLVDPSGAQRAVDQAISILRKSPQVAGFELPESSDVTAVPSAFHADVAGLTAEDLMDRADAMLAHVASESPQAVVTGGGLGASATASAFLSSEGIERASSSTGMGAGIQVTIDVDDQLTSGWEGASADGLLPEVPDCVDLAVKWAECTRDPIKVEATAGTQDVVLSEGAFGSLFGMIVGSALSGPRVARKESLWTDRLDKKVMADHLTLVDDGHLEGGARTASIDGDGMPTQRRVLVDAGRLTQVNWSVRDAAKAVADGQVDHAESTGSATRSISGPPGTSTRDLVLSSSNRRPSPEDLVAQMDDGWVVHSIMGAHTANPTSGDFSVTTSSVLRVVDGEVRGAIRQAGVTGNLAEALSGSVVLGRQNERDGRSGGHLHLADVLFSGTIGVNPA
ncbi:MAG TPA: TldD/PmbA family protein [Candidatus Poseidoniaceae archaeon]|nr:MAG TPA: TldD/PmbA family protein [Candidatus Poseidoniales archaeon]HII97032.1 TldD/PmbA family protein [Candidatus Poseidoniaceae archaeon]